MILNYKHPNFIFWPKEVVKVLSFCYSYSKRCPFLLKWPYFQHKFVYLFGPCVGTRWGSVSCYCRVESLCIRSSLGRNEFHETKRPCAFFYLGEEQVILEKFKFENWRELFFCFVFASKSKGGIHNLEIKIENFFFVWKCFHKL